MKQNFNQISNWDSVSLEYHQMGSLKPNLGRATKYIKSLSSPLYVISSKERKYKLFNKQNQIDIMDLWAKEQEIDFFNKSLEIASPETLF